MMTNILLMINYKLNESAILQMVACESENARGGFHLSARAQEERRPRAPSVSSLSLYKHKIDSLFDDSRSVASLPQYGPNLSLSDLGRRDSKVRVISFYISVLVSVY